MPDILLLRFDAPLVSFGGPIVDNRGVVQDYPPLSLLAGLLGNALGFDHRDVDPLTELQSRLRYAVRCDRPGTKLTDFQTVALGQSHLVDTGWTTRGRPEGRAGASGEDTHIRYRDFVADSVHTLAITLTPQDPSPDLDALEQALHEPARPLFLGRKSCLPATPILLGRTTAPTLLAGLRRVPPLPSVRREPIGAARARAWWPADEAATPESRLLAVTDHRDWANQILSGRRWIREGVIALGEDVGGH